MYRYNVKARELAETDFEGYTGVVVYTVRCTHIMVQKVNGGYQANHAQEFLDGKKFYPTLTLLKADIIKR